MAEGVELATAWVNLVPSTQNIRAAIEKELGGPLEDTARRSGQRSASQFADGLRMGGAVVAGAAALLGRSMAQAASDTNEALNKVDVVFGSSAQSVKDFTADSATSLGLAKRQALDYTGTLGNLLLSTGQSAEASAEMSTTLVQLAADLGSFNNVGTEDALEAIRAGLVGETEPLKRFGVNLNDATLRAKALALGIYEGTGTLTAAQKAQASYALILEQTTTAQGDFARTSDGAANKAKILAAEIDDQKARIGEGLLPVYSGLLSAGTKVVDLFDGMPPAVGAGTLALTGLGGATLFLAPKLVEGSRAALELVDATRSGAARMAEYARSMDKAKLAAGSLAAVGLAAVLVALNELGQGVQERVAGEIDEELVGIESAVERANTLRRLLREAERENASSPFRTRDLPGPFDDGFRDWIEGGTGESVAQIGAELRAVEQEILDTGTAAEIAGYQFEYFGKDAIDRATTAALKRAKGELSDTGDVAALTAAKVDKLATEWRDSLDSSLGLASSWRDQSDALDEYNRAQDTAIGRGQEWADAARRVADAEDDVAEARKGVVDATKSQQDAVRSLRDAEADALATRRGLNDAYDEARKRLESLRRTVAGDRLSIREAQIAVDEAREAAALAVDDASTLSVDEREQAQIRLERALLALAEAQARAAENAEELNDREQAGLDQSPEVLAAKEAIAAAEQRVIDAQDAVVEANDRVIDANDRVVEAEGRVTEAILARQAIQDEARKRLPELADAAIEATATVAVAVAQITGDVQGGIESLLATLDKLDPNSPLFLRVQEMLNDLRAQAAAPGYYGAQGFSYGSAPGPSVIVPQTNPVAEAVGWRSRSPQVGTINVYGADTEKWKRETRRMGGGNR